MQGKAPKARLLGALHYVRYLDDPPLLKPPMDATGVVSPVDNLQPMKPPQSDGPPLRNLAYLIT